MEHRRPNVSIWRGSDRKSVPRISRIKRFPLSPCRDQPWRIRFSVSGSSHSSTGFTLLEILVAIFIFSIIASTIFGSFRFVFGKADIIKGTVQTEEMVQICLDRMMRDLQAIHITVRPAYVSPDANGRPDPFRFVGESTMSGSREFPSIRFASMAHVSYGLRRVEGIAEIVYYVMAEDEERFVLRRSDRLHFEDTFEKKTADPILCESIKSIAVKYYDEDGEMHERWDSDSEDTNNATPRAVWVELEIGDETGSRRYQTTIFLPVHRDGTS